jgi:hypothetical protein
MMLGVSEDMVQFVRQDATQRASERLSAVALTQVKQRRRKKAAGSIAIDRGERQSLAAGNAGEPQGLSLPATREPWAGHVAGAAKRDHRQFNGIFDRVP